MAQRKIRILFKHPELRDYRIPFFQGLCEEFQIKFLFNRIPPVNNFPFECIGTPKKSMWLDVKAIKKFFKELFSSNYDVFVTSTPKSSASILGILLAKLKKRKVLIWEESWYYPTKEWKSKARFLILHPIFKIPDAFFITSSKTYKFNKEIRKKDSSKIFFAPQCSHDYSKFQTVPLDLKRMDGKRVILYLSRIIELKGLDILIQAYEAVKRKHQNTFLLIVGDGSFQKKCETLAKSLNLKDYLFYGAIPESDYAKKASLYELSDVFVLPTRFLRGRYEGWGIVVNEAMSMSKPVIVTEAVGCSGEMIQPGRNGYVVKPSSAEELKEAIIKMLADEKKSKNMGEISREIFEKNNQYEDMIKVFKEAVNSVSCT